MIERAMKMNPKVKDTEELISAIFRMEAGTKG